VDFPLWRISTLSIIQSRMTTNAIGPVLASLGDAAADSRAVTDKMWIVAGELTDPKTLPGALFYGFVTVLVAWLVGRAVSLAINRYLDGAQRAGADPTGIRFLGKLARVGIYLLAFVSYSHVVPALQKLGTAWLAGVGAASVVVGLAAQSTLGNLIAGISLVLYRPFRIGDRVQVAAPTGLETGVVVSIDLGYTVLRTADQRLLVIPNSTMAGQASINLTYTPPRTPCGVSLYVASGGDLARARQILIELAKANSKIVQVDGCFVTRVANKGVILALSAACADPDAATGIKSGLLENAKKQFDAAGIKLV
jgi:small-conductance mechanosensitive channel